MRVIQIIIGADPPDRLDKALSRDVPVDEALSRTRLARLISAGAVRRGASVLDSPKARVSPGDVIDIALPDPTESEILPEPIPLDIRFEDDDLIVVEKPAGMVVHPAPGAPNGTLVNALLAHCGADLSGVGGMRRPGIVHRIDKDTSGLLVVAKSDRAHHGLAAQFAAHTVARRYRALVFGVPDVGDPRLRGLPGVTAEAGGVVCLRTQIGRHPSDRQRQAVLSSGGRHAVTRVRVDAALGTPPGAALVTCWLETGRTHQIRVHMAHIGHPLVGDPVYGGRRTLAVRSFTGSTRAKVTGFARQALHAATLGFVHPVTDRPLSFDSPLPPDFATLLSALQST